MNMHIHNELAIRQGLDGGAQSHWNGLSMVSRLPLYKAALDRVEQDIEDEAYDRDIPVRQQTQADREWALMLAAGKAYRAKLKRMGIQR